MEKGHSVSKQQAKVTHWGPNSVQTLFLFLHITKKIN